MLAVLHQVWLAGLGAAVKAQRETPKLLDDLISEGARFQTAAHGEAEKTLRSLLGNMQTQFTSRMGKASEQATEALENLEKIFQTRVHRALTQLGVPSADVVASLSKRVDALNANIDRLARRRVAAAKARVREARVQ
jgi:poly(hydroxyalkanoate) granule-associated protein